MNLGRKCKSFQIKVVLKISFVYAFIILIINLVFLTIDEVSLKRLSLPLFGFVLSKTGKGYQRELTKENRPQNEVRTTKEVCNNPQVQNYLTKTQGLAEDYFSNKNKSKYKFNPKGSFLVHRERKFGWCMVYKAGSTSLIAMLLECISAKENKSEAYNNRVYSGPQLHKLMPPLTPNDDLTYDDITMFINVRHPFSRILSAYRDRLLRNLSNFQRTYGAKIVSKYRQKNSTTKSETPTFSEFILYLIDTPAQKYDFHWMPYSLVCHVCFINYQFVLHTETFKEDTEALKQIINLNMKNRSLHKTKLRNETINSTKIISTNWTEMEKKYFSSITKEQLLRLYDIYWLDFLLFNYTIYPYDTYV